MQLFHSSVRGGVLPIILLASAFVGLLAAGSVFISSLTSHEASMYIEPESLTAVPGDTFTASITVTAGLPVNAFTGMVTFNHDVLAVERIDYNTSIADLWTEQPWFDAGAGTINFTGGTTRPGGFIGTGTLITVTFKAIAIGDAALALRDARILQHDGLGTDAPLVAPIDSVFTVVPDSLRAIATPDTVSEIRVAAVWAATDFNHDGVTSFRDISIFMVYLTTGDVRGDISGDGHINTTDLSIVLEARKD